MENIELTCFKIISAAGEAKSYLMQALREGRKGEYEEGEELIKKAKEELLKAHDIHMEVIQQEAEGNKVEINMLLMHSEDQLMSVETLMVVVEELINVYKNIHIKA